MTPNCKVDIVYLGGKCLTSPRWLFSQIGQTSSPGKFNGIPWPFLECSSVITTNTFEKTSVVNVRPMILNCLKMYFQWISRNPLIFQYTRVYLVNVDLVDGEAVVNVDLVNGEAVLQSWQQVFLYFNASLDLHHLQMQKCEWT